jgi:hypothetical protein
MKDTTDSTPAANAGGLFVGSAAQWAETERTLRVGTVRDVARAFQATNAPPKVWRDEACGCPQSALDPDGPPNGAHPMWEPACARCNNTGRILEPAE